jgi:hypothetical protein
MTAIPQVVAEQEAGAPPAAGGGAGGGTGGAAGTAGVEGVAGDMYDDMDDMPPPQAVKTEIIKAHNAAEIN